MRLILCAVLAASLSVPAAALSPEDVQEHTLENGMKVLFWQDNSIPSLAIYTYWKVGSRNEAPGITGLAHFFEHMMFNGSKNYPPGDFDKTMEAAGGANNAYTSNDVTVYQDWVPAEALELTLGMEADRIGYLSVDPEVVESERGVVMSERRRSVDDDNHSLMWELMQSVAFAAHPYSWPVIGWASDIESWRQEDVEQFFKDWYTPNNAVMIICGAFDENEALGILNKTVGALPSREIPRDVTTVEPPQRGERRAVLSKEASSASILVSWHVPETASEDMPVLELIDRLLTSGESSRLHKNMVNDSAVALWVWSGTDRNFDPGLFQILVQNREGVSGEAAEEALYQQIEDLIEHPPSESELSKVKNQYLADFYREMATLSGRADALGSYEVFHGDWRKLFKAGEVYSGISSEDIKRVAQKYFTQENRTVVTLVPTGGAGE